MAWNSHLHYQGGKEKQTKHILTPEQSKTKKENTTRILLSIKTKEKRKKS
jgi:hypothetical protein